VGSAGTLKPCYQDPLSSLSLVTVTATNLLLDYHKPKAWRIKIHAGLTVIHLKHWGFCWPFENLGPIQSSLCPYPQHHPGTVSSSIPTLQIMFGLCSLWCCHFTEGKWWSRSKCAWKLESQQLVAYVFRRCKPETVNCALKAGNLFSLLLRGTRWMIFWPHTSARC